MVSSAQLEANPSIAEAIEAHQAVQEAAQQIIPHSHRLWRYMVMPAAHGALIHGEMLLLFLDMVSMRLNRQHLLLRSLRVQWLAQ